MEYLKINSRTELTKFTIPQLDELITRLKAPRMTNIQRNLEPKTDKINTLLRFYRRLFDAGKLYVACEGKVKNGEKKDN